MQTTDALSFIVVVVVVVVWIAATAFLVPFVALQKGRSGWLWALAAVVFAWISRPYMFLGGPERQGQWESRMAIGVEGGAFKVERHDHNLMGNLYDSTSVFFSLPCWLAAGVAGVLPVIWLAERFRAPGRAPGVVCMTFGYDLRATPGRCPECGTLTK